MRCRFHRDAVRVRKVQYFPVEGLGEVRSGTNLAAQIVSAVGAQGQDLESGDVVVVAQKIVSKAAGRTVALSDVQPSERASALARQCGKDPRFVELVLRESTALVRVAPNVLIVRHRLGFVMANAGVDQSNVPGAGANDMVLLLPVEPDTAAREIREDIASISGVSVGIVISDSFGRPWREGVVNVAIGAVGVPSLIDRRERTDRQGRALKVTQIAWADAVAAGAGLLMGEADEGIPAVVVRGLKWIEPERTASALVRPMAQDLFS